MVADEMENQGLLAEEKFETIEIADDNLELNIKTLSSKPFKVTIKSNAQVRDLKDEILAKSDTKDKYIRLIYQGKLMSDDNASLLDYKLITNSFIHCAITATPSKQISPPVANADSESAENPHSNRGFDRLRSHLSAEEVQALRLHFYPQIAPLIAQSTPEEGENTEERIYRVEEEWMAAQGPRSEFALNVRPSVSANSSRGEHTIEMLNSDFSYNWMAADVDGSLADFIWGFVIGMLLGFILLFWLWERTVPRKQKLGILTGVFLNIILSVIPNTYHD